MYEATAIVCGRLAADPMFFKGSKEDGTDDRTLFRLMVNEPGQKDPDVINCITWGPRARATNEHCKKGKEVLVRGRIKTFSQKNEDDGTYKNFWEVRVEHMSFGALSLKSQQEAPAGATAPTALTDLEQVKALLQDPRLQALMEQLPQKEVASPSIDNNPF